MYNERSYQDPDDGAEPPGEAMPGWTLRASIDADLEEIRAVSMRFVRRMDAMAETEEGQKMLPQLNTAMVKAARAVRLTAVLQLEVAGLRQQANSRAPAAGPADGPPNLVPERFWGLRGPRPSPKPWENGDFECYDGYTQAERYLAAEAKVDADLERLEAALTEDFQASGRSVNGESPKQLFKLILGVPHPAVDECIKTIEPAILESFFGEDLLPPKLGPGQPGVLEEWDAFRKKHGLGRKQPHWPGREDSS